jgi:outer membrane protein
MNHYTKVYLLTLCVLLISFSISLKAQEKKWSLKSCIDSALQNNLTIQQYSNTSETNRIILNQSKANLLPTFSGSASQSFNSGRSLNPVSYQFITGNVWSNNFSINGSVPIFTGFQNSNTIKQNQLNYESSKYDIESIKNDIIINIVNAYLQALFANELVKNSQNQVVLTTVQLNKTKDFFVVGAKSESDVLQLKADLASKNLTVINAKGQLKTAKLNLQQLMNIPLQSSFDVEYPNFIEPETSNLNGTQEILASALNMQPSIKSSQLKTQSVIYAIKTSKGIMLPRLSLSGSLATNYSNASKVADVNYINTIQNIGYLQSNSSEIVLGTVAQPVYNYSKYPFEKQINDNFSKSLSLSLSIPIYNSQTRYNIQKQKISLENAKLNEIVAISSLQKNIEKAYTDVENGMAKYIATKEQVTALAASFENANLKYDNQLISTSDLLVEKNKYTQAQSDNIQAKYELLFFIKILDYYKGIPIKL